MSEPKDIYEWKERISGASDIRSVYDEEAVHYDRVIRGVSGYVAPDHAVELFAPLVSPEARVLDAGSGTGIVGELLHARGFRSLEGFDSSNGMLERARGKGVYTTLVQAESGKALPFDSAAFDAVIAVGFFGPTHAPPSGLDELLRVTRSGGHIVVSMSVAERGPDTDFGQRVDDLLHAHRWRHTARSQPFRGFQTLDTDRLFVVDAFEVL